MGKAIMLNGFQQFCFQNYFKFLELKKRNEKIKKLRALYRASYRYYLKKYLQTKRVDLPDFFYLLGLTTCSEALEKANRAMDYAVSLGEEHINKSYKKLIKGGKRGR